MNVSANTTIQSDLLNAAVQRAQQEIVADIEAGTVPADVRSFADLHDHVDAKYYGGCCDESAASELQGLDLWSSVYPREAGEDEEVLGSRRTLDALNEMQGRLDAWIGSGGHRN